ncbi:MAG: DUF1292 domain-containing protein [Bacilli bacterium]|nr:DUF1292 domain-containing protein [Bacilli bacterium]
MEFDINDEKIQIEKNGKIVDCDVLFTFDSEDTMKSYIGYTDHSFGSNGRKNIFVSAYNPLKAKIELEDITDERELKMVSEVLNQIDKENA